MLMFIRMRQRTIRTHEIILQASEDAVFWNVMLCGPVETYQRFGGPHCLHLQDLKLEAGDSSDTPLSLYQIMGYHILAVLHSLS
jgi:hypothetical protein